MKVVFSPPTDDGWMVLHFDCELPLPPAEPRSLPFFLRCPLCFSRSLPLKKIAMGMAIANRGRFVVEMADPEHHFLRFLEDLLISRGMERAIIDGRYRMCVQVGGLFSPAEVARAVAECVQRYFYPEDELTVEPLPPEDIPSFLLEK